MITNAASLGAFTLVSVIVSLAKFLNTVLPKTVGYLKNCVKISTFGFVIKVGTVAYSLDVCRITPLVNLPAPLIISLR